MAQNIQAQAQTLFDKYDTDKNGVLDSAEIQGFLKEFLNILGKPNALAAAKSIVNKHDHNNDGLISREELYSSLPELQNLQ